MHSMGTQELHWHPWSPSVSMEVSGAHGFHGHPWNPWVPVDSRLLPTTFRHPFQGPDEARIGLHPHAPLQDPHHHPPPPTTPCHSPNTQPSTQPPNRPPKQPTMQPQPPPPPSPGPTTELSYQEASYDFVTQKAKFMYNNQEASSSAFYPLCPQKGNEVSFGFELAFCALQLHSALGRRSSNSLHQSKTLFSEAAKQNLIINSHSFNIPTALNFNWKTHCRASHAHRFSKHIWFEGRGSSVLCKFDNLPHGGAVEIRRVRTVWWGHMQDALSGSKC